MTRTWSKTPTEPGWYWCDDPDRYDHPDLKGDPPDAVELVDCDGSLCAFSPSRDRWMPYHEYAPPARWLGPITPDDVARADGPKWGAEGDYKRAEIPKGGAVVSAGMRLTSDIAFHPGTQCHGRDGVLHVELDDQTAADARVGRMLREISEAAARGGCRNVDYHQHLDDDEHDDVTVERSGGARIVYTGPDALERAHAEVCGKGGAFTYYPLSQPPEPPAEPDDIKIEWEPVERLCERCGVASASTVKPAPAEPDYEGMDDDALTAAAGLVSSDFHTVEIDDERRTALRAALIAFLRGREG